MIWQTLPNHSVVYEETLFAFVPILLVHHFNPKHHLGASVQLYSYCMFYDKKKPKLITQRFAPPPCGCCRVNMLVFVCMNSETRFTIYIFSHLRFRIADESVRVLAFMQFHRDINIFIYKSIPNVKQFRFLSWVLWVFTEIRGGTVTARCTQNLIGGGTIMIGRGVHLNYDESNLGGGRGV